MASFRITNKVKSEITHKELERIPVLLEPLDDWCIDIFETHGEEIYIITHSDSLLSFLIPKREICDITSSPECIKILLTEFLYENELEDLLDDVNRIFSSKNYFYKMDNPSLSSYVNNFKRSILHKITINNLDYASISWDDMMDFINSLPIKGKGYKQPLELAKEIFSEILVK